MNISKNPVWLITVLASLILTIAVLIKIPTDPSLPAPLIDVTTLIHDALPLQTKFRAAWWLLMSMVIYLSIGVIYSFGHYRLAPENGQVVKGAITTAVVTHLISSLSGTLLAVLYMPMVLSENTNMSEKAISTLLPMMMVGSAINGVMGVFLGLFAAVFLSGLSSFVTSHFFKQAKSLPDTNH